MTPFTFNTCKNGNFFGSFHFCFSSCRHFVDSLKKAAGSPLRGLPAAFFAVLFDYLAAFFARSHRAVNAAGSWIAVSESILRFISIPACFRPYMKRE